MRQVLIVCLFGILERLPSLLAFELLVSVDLIL